jgi:hypothetical protein
MGYSLFCLNKWSKTRVLENWYMTNKANGNIRCRDFYTSALRCILYEIILYEISQSRCVYHLICFDILWKFRIDTQLCVCRTMSILKLRQVCERDARSSRRQMVAVLSTLCIGSWLNKFSVYYYTKYIYSLRNQPGSG